MRILLDTNIIIHREANRVLNQNIGVLFNWLDRLHYSKCVHPLTAEELGRHSDKSVTETMQIKLLNYQVLEAPAPMHADVQKVGDTVDIQDNDANDTKLLNEVYAGRVDSLVSEDKKIHQKAKMLGISEKVFRIEELLEKLVAENPDFVDYNVLSVKRELFGNIELSDEFFDSFRGDYPGFDEWYNRKAGANEKAYVCYQ